MSTCCTKHQDCPFTDCSHYGRHNIIKTGKDMCSRNEFGKANKCPHKDDFPTESGKTKSTFARCKR